MNKFKKSVVPLLTLTLLVGFIIRFRLFVMDYIVKPVALLLWAAWRILASVDQNVYWVALIVFCAVLIIRLIPSGKDDSPGLAYGNTYKPPNRVEYWQTLIAYSVLGKNKSENLRNNMKELYMSVISVVERPAASDAKEIIEEEIQALSPAARQFLFLSNDKNETSSIKELLNNNVFGPAWLRVRRKKYNHQNNTILHEILNWMEIKLEIKDEK